MSRIRNIIQCDIAKEYVKTMFKFRIARGEGYINMTKGINKLFYTIV